MWSLIYFELKKIWNKKSFVFITCLLLIINIFFLWYTNLENEKRPSLSSYKMFQTEILNMSESEKEEYVKKLKKDIDGIYFVIDILNMQKNEIGSSFVEQELNENPGVFETYYEIYKSGNYLHFTSSLEQEQIFINEIYNEQVKVSGYDDYLEGIKKDKGKLEGISIFNNQDENNFSTRNIKKSAKDYSGLNSSNVKFIPSKTIISTIENIGTDILLILITFLFIGNLITEEKEKKLFYVTRSTKYGVVHSIFAKIIALFIHCIIFSILLFSINYLFFGIFGGFNDLGIKLQSLAPYMESNFNGSILEYLIISILTKGIVVFGIGTIITAICIISDSMILPYMLGISFLGISWLFYKIIPAVSNLNIIKHLNIFGILKTENLYGSYLNFNFFEYPISRITFSWIMIVGLLVLGIFLCVKFFLKGKSLELKRSTKNFILKFKPHTSLFKHELYKILITNKGIIIILIFSLLICYNELQRRYSPSLQEQYYQNIMLKLEGKPTEEKTELIKAEKSRFDEAFSKISEIDEQIAKGEINDTTGEAMKVKWYSITAFYPTFEKVLEQDKYVKENNGNYIYDTGYLYLFGVMDEGILNDFILLTLSIIFMFCNVMAIDYQNKAVNILQATNKGKKAIIKTKVKATIIIVLLLCILPFVCRFISVSRAFPINGFLLSAKDISIYHNLPSGILVIGLILLKIFIQVFSGIIMAMLILTISAWKKNNVQTIFLGLLILCVPLVLVLLGFEYMRLFSLYPLYSYTFGN